MSLGVSFAMLGTAAMAETPAKSAAKDDEVELGTLKVKDRTSDTNPYTSEGAPYKARVSGDSRRVKPLAETPQTITVITETQLKESGDTDLRAILDAQPGVTVGTGENGNAFGDRYIIRGQEMRSDVFVDGLRDPGMTIRESFDVEQIELTKGPSATFAGRGTAGGAVNSISKKATTAYDFTNAEIGGGTDNHIRVTGDTNVMLNEKIALRVNGLYGYEDVPDRAPADRKRIGAALSGLVEASEKVNILFDYYHLTAKDRPDLGTFIPVGGRPVADIPSYSQDGDFLNSKVDTFTARIKVTPQDGIRIENAARYGMTDNGYVVTGARGVTRAASDPVAPGAADFTLSTHQGWQEVKYFVDQLNAYAEFDTGILQHNAILGAEFSDHKVRNGVYSTTNTGANNCRVSPAVTSSNPLGYTNNICIANGVANIANVLGRNVVKGTWDSDWHVKTRSLYLMDTIDVTKWVTLFGGVRMDDFDYSNTLQNTNTLVKTPNKYSDTLWNYHAGIVVKPVEHGNFYFSYGSASEINGGESDLGGNCGYGGICIVNNATSVGDGRPERVTNFELGTKWDLFNDRLLLTAAAFHMIKSNVFEGAVGNSYTTSGTLNTGRHRVQGVEFGLVGNITDKLSGQAGIAFMKSKILSSVDANSIGLALSNFANNTATAQLRYEATKKFSFGGTATYSSSVHGGQPDTAAAYNATTHAYNINVPGYVVFDAFATYKINAMFQVRLNVQNIANKDYYLASYRGGTFTYIGDARNARLSLSAKF